MNEYLSVGALTAYLADIISQDPLLGNVWVKAEISGFKLYQQSGHMYFTLKDEEASISGVMFKSRARYLNFEPKDGMAVLARGYLSVFARQGKYQLYVEEMFPFGAGALYLYLERLKTKLNDAGYFSLERKKSIPPLVNCVGVVTSQEGAALGDILRVLRLRHPGIHVVLAHAAVQGDNAPVEIAQGIRNLNQLEHVQVIIVGRGGGSFEDLMAFNSEMVVQAVFDSQKPIISAVGHETDFTLADMAADVRAATPTQAAQLAVEDMAVWVKAIERWQTNMSKIILRRIQYHYEWLDKIMLKPVWSNPEVMVENRRREWRQFTDKLMRAAQNTLQEKANQWILFNTALDKLSPLKTIERGFAIVQKDEAIIKSGQKVNIGDPLQLILHDARLWVEVKSKEEGSPY